MTILIPTQQRMEIARQIADAACCLDVLGSMKISEQVMCEALLMAQTHAQTLHDIAHFMAGLDVDEIYQPEEFTPMEECGDAASGQPCKNTSPQRCGNCPILDEQAHRVEGARMTA